MDKLPPQIPIVALNDSRKQWQSGFQSVPWATEIFLDRNPCNALIIRILYTYNDSLQVSFWSTSPDSKKSKKILSTMYPRPSKEAKWLTQEARTSLIQV